MRRTNRINKRKWSPTNPVDRERWNEIFDSEKASENHARAVEAIMDEIYAGGTAESIVMKIGYTIASNEHDIEFVGKKYDEAASDFAKIEEDLRKQIAGLKGALVEQKQKFEEGARLLNEIRSKTYKWWSLNK